MQNCSMPLLPNAQAVALRPDWPESHITLARVQLNFGEPLLALRSYQAAAKLQPQHPDLVSGTVLVDGAVNSSLLAAPLSQPHM